MRLIDNHRITIKNSKTIVSFENNGEYWKKWDRYISIEGKQAYHIGNVCGTCEFFFERLEGANQTINPKEAIEELNIGLNSINNKTIDIISEIIPNGEYEILLLEISPKLINLSTQDDYFVKEQTDLWGMNGFWGLPHHPKVEYYRGSDDELGKERKLFEFIAPLAPVYWADKERVEHYKEKINLKNKPTAIALGILDIKQPANWNDNLDPNINEHWCFTHYLLDGHHKILAASQLNKPITILTFLATDKGVSTKENIKELMDRIKNVG